MVKDYSLDKFEELMKENGIVLPDEVVDRVVEIGKGITYLHN